MFSFLFSLFAALAAITAERVQTPRPPGAEKRTVTDVTLSDEYVEGGEALTPADLGLKKVRFAHCTLKDPGEATANIAQIHYDPAEERLQVFDETPGEVASEGVTKAAVVQVIAFGY